MGCGAEDGECRSEGAFGLILCSILEERMVLHPEKQHMSATTPPKIAPTLGRP